MLRMALPECQANEVAGGYAGARDSEKTSAPIRERKRNKSRADGALCQALRKVSSSSTIVPLTPFRSRRYLGHRKLGFSHSAGRRRLPAQAGVGVFTV